MSKIEVNAIEPQCGTTLTVGASGDTITFPSGTTVVNNGSQTGFGRTGTVDWQTGSIKTGTFTAVNGEGYFVDTSSGVSTANLPAGSAGAIVSFADYTRTFQTNKLTITPNGSEKIGGVAANFVAQTEGQSITLVYVDATEGWINTAESTGQSGVIPSFITATGGTITTVCTDYKVHTFTGPGTFTVCSVGNPAGSNTVDYLVVAGGGGGGSSHGGGGGAGGFRESSGAASGCYTASPLGSCVSALPVSISGYPITVGAGGAAVSVNTGSGNNGNNSVFSTITSTAGGGGGGEPTGDAGNGGSGGGKYACRSLGLGNTPPVSPPQGNNGGSSAHSSPNYGQGGGGGATTTGVNGTSTTGGNGGTGATTSIVGSATSYAGGGGGSTYAGGTSGTGGTGGGGNGTKGGPGGTNGTAGTTNTGGGGGGGERNVPNTDGFAGGSGIVIIRYKFQ
jgi:hypothetical protein